MAGVPPDRPFKPVEEEERAEKSVPAKTTEEEEEEEVRTEEDEHKEEAFGSLLDFDPNNSVLNPSIEDNEPDEENENPRQDSITITRRYQTMRRGSITFTIDQNQRLVISNRSGAQMSQVVMPPEEDAGSIDSLITQPPSPDPRVNQNRWSDQTMERGSTSFAIDQNNRRLLLPNRYGAQMSQAMMPPEDNLFAQPPYQNQVPRRDHTINQPHRYTLPNRGFTSVASVQNDVNQSFGVVQQQQQWPRFIPDHNYAAGFGPNGAPWGPLMPNQNTFLRGPAPVDHNYYATWRYQQQQMVIMQMQNQNIVPRPGFVADQNHFNQSFGMQQQDQIVPNAAPVQAPMWPMMYNQDQIVPNIVTGRAPMRPMMQQDHVVPSIVPGRAPMRAMMYNQEQDHVVPYIVPGQALMRPMMYNQEQDQIVPYIVPGQALLRPMMYNQEQDQIVPYIVPGQALMRPMMYNQEQDQIVPYYQTLMRPMMQQDQIVPDLLPGQNLMRPMMQQDPIVPYLVPGQAPMRPMTYNQEQDQIVPYYQTLVRPMMYNQEDYQIAPTLVGVQAPMVYNQDQIVPYLVPVQAPMWPMMYNQDQIVPMAVPNRAPMMYNQQQQINQAQHFGFPIDTIHDQAFPNATAEAPRPALNRQQMQQLQLQPQTQQPMQSQGFNAGPSSDQSQD